MIGRRATRSHERFGLIPVLPSGVPVATRREADRLAAIPGRMSDTEILRLGLPGVATRQDRVRSVCPRQIRMLVPTSADAPMCRRRARRS